MGLWDCGKGDWWVQESHSNAGQEQREGLKEDGDSVCRSSNLMHLDAFPAPESVQLDWEWHRNTVLNTHKSRDGNSFGG